MQSYAHTAVVEKVREGMSDQIPPLFLRELSLGEPQTPARGNIVNLVTGVRRCGKTFRLYQEMASLLERGVRRESILYFNFDDERLRPFRTELLEDVITTFEQLNPEATKGCYLFLDEIQDVPEWGGFLRRMVDTREATIYVTGSSSRMLSSEMPSEFRGRSIPRELFPLSFREFCRREGDPLIDPSSVTSAQKGLIRHRLDAYLARGGFPAARGLSLPDAYQLLQGYVTQTVAQDVVEHQGLANARAARLFASRCIASSAREISLNRVRGQMASLGVSASRETLALLLGYYEESYLVFKLGEYSRALADNPRSASKVYTVDPGLLAAFSPAPALDMGQRLETATFVALRRAHGGLRTGGLARATLVEGSVRHEVDFVMGDAMLGQPPLLVQCCVSMADPATRRRELRALAAGMRNFGCSESWVVTLDDQEDVPLGEGVVHVVPAWAWLYGR